MALPPSPDPDPLALPGALDQLSGALAGARTMDEVAAVLPAVAAALGAQGSALLLVDGARLRPHTRSGTLGDGSGTRLDDPLEGPSPAAEALRQGRPLVVGRGPRTDVLLPPGPGAGATVAVPLEQEHRPLGAVILDFPDAHSLTAETWHGLRVLAVHGALALRRCEHFGELQRLSQEHLSRAEALQAFLTLTEAVGSTTDLHALTRHAREVLRATLPDLAIDYFERRGERWVSLFIPEDVPALLRPALEAGFPLDTPAFERAARQRAPLFIDHWDAAEQRVPHSESYRMVALAPYEQAGQVVAMLTSASQTTPEWTAAQRAIFTAVWRALGGALERSAQARQLERQSALDAFVAFTEQSTRLTDVHALARQAASVLRATLGEVTVMYFELSGGRWRARIWSDDLELALAAELQAGFSTEVPSVAEAIRSRAVVFIDGWDAEREGVAQTEAYSAAAAYPYFTGDDPCGLLTMGSRRQGAWTAREQAVFRSVGASLGLAIERVEEADRLRRQTEELDSRNRALEAFAQLSRDLALETDPHALIRRAQAIVLSLLSPGYAVYYEPEGDCWRLKTQVGDLGNAELQRLVDAGLPYDSPTLRTPWVTGEPQYQDQYAQGADTPAELVTHVHAAAVLPLRVNGTPVGLFGLGLFEQRTWSAIDRAMLSTALHSLELALERAAAVAQLARSHADLSVANAELEAFAYSVSHDLRTPVRHIAGFSEILRRGLGERLDATSGRSLDVIEGAAGRMNTLIDAMLDLSRSSRRPLQLDSVALDELFGEVAAELEAGQPGRQVEWHLAALPVVLADRSTLRQVVANLLANALKYSGGRAVSRVRVWAQEHPEEWAVFVQDNGVGFDEQYVDKLFGVFQRLHRQDEFEGSGVGLATVRRIVLRHGGRVSASSALGQGATFGFTLPKTR